jgi:hypothetical protein
MVTGKRRLPGRFVPRAPNWSPIRLASWTISPNRLFSEILDPAESEPGFLFSVWTMGRAVLGFCGIVFERSG